MSHVRVWRFRPRPGEEEAFARAYAGDGPWAHLFSRSDQFLSTQLLHPAEPRGWWLTIDRWQSRAAFEDFQLNHGDDYRALDGQLKAVATQEEFMGAFEERAEVYTQSRSGALSGKKER